MKRVWGFALAGLLAGCNAEANRDDASADVDDVKAFCNRMDACSLFDAGDTAEECVARNDDVPVDCLDCMTARSCSELQNQACSTECAR